MEHKGKCYCFITAIIDKGTQADRGEVESVNEVETMEAEEAGEEAESDDTLYDRVHIQSSDDVFTY